MNPFDDSDADDLRPVTELLRARRPEATALELDAVKQRVRARVAGGPAGRRARSASPMKSRLAILSMLVAGMLLSTTGAGLAVSGLGTGNDASVAQYGSPNPGGSGQSPQQGSVKPETSQSPGSKPVPANGPAKTQGNAPHTTTAPTVENGSSSPSALQPARQVETGAGNLPFTGFLAIPVLLGGVALLTAGLILRRRSGPLRD